MSDKKHNLSKAELAAIDFMIAYMQENKQTQLGGFISSIVDAVTDAAKSVANVVTNVATTATQGITNVANTATQAVTNVAQAAGGVKGASPELISFSIGKNPEVQKFLSSFESTELSKEITLDELIKIRNQYNK